MQRPFSFLLLLIVLTACGEPALNVGLTAADIPDYPNATAEGAMSQSLPMGMGGGLRQLSTTDDFDTVVGFYESVLAGYEGMEKISNTSSLGRQVALAVPVDDGMISVSIQAFEDEGNVTVTIMSVVSG